MSVRTWHAPDARAAPVFERLKTGTRPSTGATAAKPPTPKPPAPAERRPPLADDLLLQPWAAGGARVELEMRDGRILTGVLVGVAKYVLAVREDGRQAPTAVMKHAVDVMRLAEGDA